MNIPRDPTATAANEGAMITIIGDVYRFLATDKETGGKYAVWVRHEESLRWSLQLFSKRFVRAIEFEWIICRLRFFRHGQFDDLFLPLDCIREIARFGAGCREKTE